ncbi:MAG: stage sporulation protein [Clostridia bacterium]|nr:stage sporulation protein [Clostridia bacterium]
MLPKLNETIRRHLSDNIISYAIILFFFILGISLGALTVNNIDIDTKSSIKAYIDGFISISRTDSINSAEILRQSIKLNLLTAAALFIFGLTYAGILLVPAISAFRGFCLGFTVAFLTDSLGKGGFLLALVSILPQNLIYLPVLLIICVCSISLSIAVLRNKLNRKHNELSSFVWSYTLSVLFLFTVMIGGSIIEAYLTPFLVKLVAPYLM